jgi:hypothetical protein
LVNAQFQDGDASIAAPYMAVWSRLVAAGNALKLRFQRVKSLLFGRQSFVAGMGPVEIASLPLSGGLKTIHFSKFALALRVAV